MNGQDRSDIELLRLEMRGRLDLIASDVTFIKKSVDDHEVRIRAAERWRFSLPLSLIILGMTVIGGVLGKVF